jgi:hypothetical protein
VECAKLSGVDFISGGTTKQGTNQFIPVGQGFFVVGRWEQLEMLFSTIAREIFIKEDEVGVLNYL